MTGADNNPPARRKKLLESALLDEIKQYEDGYWYILIDSAQLPDLPQAIKRGPLRHLPRVSLFDTLYRHGQDRGAQVGADAGPYLFALSPSEFQEPALDYTLDKALETYGVSWLVSPLPMSELALRLAKRTEAKLTENMEVLLRFYDSRVLPNVIAVLTTQQADIFSSISHGWWYADRDESLRSCRCQFKQDDPFHHPLEFSQEQENALTELAFPDTVLEQLQHNQSDLVGRMNRAELHAFVKRQIVNTNALGLDSMPDILAYCVLALLKGEDDLVQMETEDKIALLMKDTKGMDT